MLSMGGVVWRSHQGACSGVGGEGEQGSVGGSRVGPPPGGYVCAYKPVKDCDVDALLALSAAVAFRLPTVYRATSLTSKRVPLRP